MKYRRHFPYLIICALAVLCAAASAQSGLSHRLVCQSIGNGAAEPLGDREGHALSVGNFTCRTDGGPLDGGVLTGATIWEYDKLGAVGLSGSGVTRKPGAMAAYMNTESKLTMTLVDGMVTGLTGTGWGRHTLASGSAAALSGKAYSYTFGSTGAGQFGVDVKVE